MKKILNFMVLGSFLLGTSLVVLPSQSAQAGLQESPYGVSHGKRCEKCQRGKDGKMVCKPVPCP